MILQNSAESEVNNPPNVDNNQVLNKLEELFNQYVGVVEMLEIVDLHRYEIPHTLSIYSKLKYRMTTDKNIFEGRNLILTSIDILKLLYLKKEKYSYI